MEMLRNSQPRKPAHRGRRRRRRRHCRQKKRNRPLATKRFAFAPISFPNNGSASQFQATPIPIGLKPGDNYWPSWEKVKQRDALLRVLSAPLLHHSALSIRYCPPGGTVDSPSAISKSGATLLIFSISRFIANGFGRKPRTPASFINSWARASSPRPEIRINGGTTIGGFT